MLSVCMSVRVRMQISSSMADDLDIEAMLEAPYRKVRLSLSSVL